MKLEDLVTTQGADRLRLALGLDMDQVSKIQVLADSMVGGNPHIRETFLGKAKPGISFYDFKNNKLGLGHASTDVLAHEMGHAASLANASDFYKALLRGSKKATKWSNTAALPLSALIAKYPKLTRGQRKKLLLGAAAVSGAVALPNLLEEANASVKATYHSPTKLRTGLAMLPGLVSHSSHDLTAPTTYILANKLIGDEDD
jgi:hypothetical protein